MNTRRVRAFYSKQVIINYQLSPSSSLLHYRLYDRPSQGEEQDEEGREGKEATGA